MKKYIITITPIIENQPLPTVVLDISTDTFLVNYPKDAGVKVDSRNVHSHSELCVKMPHDDRELHLWYDEDSTLGTQNPKVLG